MWWATWIGSFPCRTGGSSRGQPRPPGKTITERPWLMLRWLKGEWVAVGKLRPAGGARGPRPAAALWLRPVPVVTTIPWLGPTIVLSALGAGAAVEDAEGSDPRLRGERGSRGGPREQSGSAVTSPGLAAGT